nr:DIE2/ALG10 family [Tanacetum cinerariifolium]
EEKDGNPVMVLDDSCVNQHDFSCCVNGKVKEFGSLVNLKMVLRNEETLGWTLDFEEQSDDESESDNEQPDDVIKEDISGNEEEDLGEAEVSEIPDTMAENVVLNVDDGNEVNQSDDPFDIYSLLK